MKLARSIDLREIVAMTQPLLLDLPPHGAYIGQETNGRWSVFKRSLASYSSPSAWGWWEFLNEDGVWGKDCAYFTSKEDAEDVLCLYLLKAAA